VSTRVHASDGVAVKPCGGPLGTVKCKYVLCIIAERSEATNNRTPGSRSYSDLLDTLADSVCIHLLVLRIYCPLNIIQ